MTDQQRYDGRPMLKVLDAYVLDAMGVLDDETRGSMEAMAPKIAAALGVDAPSWQSTVEQAMEMPADSASALRDIWAASQAQAAAEGAEIDPVEFAHTLVDAQYGDAVD